MASSWRGRVADDALTPWNRGRDVSGLVTQYFGNVEDWQIMMLEDTKYAIPFVSRMRSAWGYVRALIIQKEKLPKEVKEIDSEFDKIQQVALNYANQRYSNPILAFNVLNDFFDKIKLITQLAGFGIPSAKERMSTVERIDSLEDM